MRVIKEHVEIPVCARPFDGCWKGWKDKMRRQSFASFLPTAFSSSMTEENRKPCSSHAQRISDNQKIIKTPLTSSSGLSTFFAVHLINLQWFSLSFYEEETDELLKKRFTVLFAPCHALFKTQKTSGSQNPFFFFRSAHTWLGTRDWR